MAIEIGTSVSAPYAGLMLAGLGADLIKIERKGTGDDGRTWGKIFPDGTSSMFHAFNANKRSIALDLRAEADRDRLKRLCIRKADIVIQNMRPGRIDKMGLGAKTLTDANKRLIYCNVSAFGAKGPLKDQPGYDPLMQAYSGLMAITGEEGRPPIRVGVSIIDMATGMWSVVGILAALNRRHITGQGCIVDSSLYETALAWMANPITNYQVEGVNPERTGSGARGMAPYQAYECTDGWLVVAAPNDNLFAKLSDVLGHSEWPSNPSFADNQKRYANLAELNALLEPIFREQPRAHWQELLDNAGIPNAPVKSTAEMMVDPQALALGMLQSWPAGGPQIPAIPLSFDGLRPPLRGPAPKLGEHNEDLKADFDL
jgi:crotonobetainyl-CoA:carnitine CoA-transferase CaiB-like acyl-CoA transferase